MPNNSPLSTIEAATINGGLTAQSGYLDRLRDAAEGWALDTENELKMAAPTNTGALFNSIKRNIRYRDGFPYSITFKMLRYGAYIEKGASRGHGGQKGSIWTFEGGKASKHITKYRGKIVSQKRYTDRNALGEQGKGSRPAKPFFNPTVEANIGKLADAAAGEYADLIVRFVGIK